MAKTKIAVTLDSKLLQQLDALVAERRFAGLSSSTVSLGGEPACDTPLRNTPTARPCQVA